MKKSECLLFSARRSFKSNGRNQVNLIDLTNNIYLTDEKQYQYICFFNSPKKTSWRIG
jgi:hypothetical protein